MYGVNKKTFCANSVNFWDSYNAFWKLLFQQFCLNMQNWISREKKQPTFSKILGQLE